MNELGISDRDHWLLRACLRNERGEVQEAFNAWREFANPFHMQVREFRLVPLLLANLRRARIDNPRLAWMRGQAKHIWLTGAIRVRVMSRALDQLTDAGIPVVLIKGAALFARWQTEVETRFMADFDLLVPCDRVRDGLAILRGTGWSTTRPELLTDYELERFYASTVWGSKGNALDLHWRPTEIILDSSHAEGVFARAITGKIDRRRVRMASLTDHLFILLAHEFNNAASKRPDWVAEVALLFRLGNADDWDWPLFFKLCRRYRLEYWAQQALSAVQEISGEPLPTELREASSVWALRNFQSQKREVELRGRSALCSLDLLARRRGKAARGQSPVVEKCTSGPVESLAQAQNQHASAADFASVGPEGFDLSRHPGGASFLHGWSVLEEFGRWTDGDVALLALRVQGARLGDSVPVSLEFLASDAPELKATAWAGDEVTSWSLRRASGLDHHRSIQGRLVTWGTDAALPLLLRFEGLLPLEERMRLDKDHHAPGIFLRRLAVGAAWMLPELDQPLQISQPGANLVTFSGWSDLESPGRWSVGQEARLLFRLPKNSALLPRGIRLTVLHCFSSEPNGQEIEIYLNGAVVLRKLLPEGATATGPGLLPGGALDIDVPSSLSPGSVVDLRLRFSSPASPRSLGLSQDSRCLGIFLSQVSPVIAT